MVWSVTDHVGARMQKRLAKGEGLLFDLRERCAQVLQPVDAVDNCSRSALRPFFDEMFPVDDYFRIPGAYIVIPFQQLHACGQVEPFEIGAD